MDVNLPRIVGAELSENSRYIYPCLTLTDFIREVPLEEEKKRLAKIWIAAYDFKRLKGNNDYITLFDLIIYAKDEEEKDRISEIWLKAGTAKVEQESSCNGCAHQIQ